MNLKNRKFANLIFGFFFKANLLFIFLHSVNLFNHYLRQMMGAAKNARLKKFYWGAVVVAKWLEQWPCNLEVVSSNPLGAGLFLFFFFHQWQSVLSQVPQERCNFAVFLFSYTLSCVA